MWSRKNGQIRFRRRVERSSRVERAFRRLPDEAVVSRAEVGARLLSACALVGEEAAVATQNADNNRVCITMFPCSPRPRKRGALHGFALA